MEIGERIWLCDDRQRRYHVEIIRVNSRELSGTVLEERQAPLSQSPSIVLAQALLKGERMDWLIQKATELGVRAIVPLLTRHGVVKPHYSRVDAQLTRWQRIALEAAQQSEQWVVPSIRLPAEVDTFFPKPDHVTTKLILNERATGQSLRSVPLPSGPDASIVVVTGPEGGWAPEETELAEQSGFTSVTLGPRILRAETATLAAVSLVQSRLGELG